MTKPFYTLPADLGADIEAYAQEVSRFVAGEMPAGVFKAKRVPRGVYEQRINGMYMVRVRVAGGTLSCDQIRVLAELSQRFSNGSLHVTTRQDVQLHELRIEDTPEVMRVLKDAGLTSKGGGGNTVRNITACPYAGLCPMERFDVTSCAHAVTECLIPLVGSYNLPRKYKIAFSGCAADCALAQAADLGFVAEARDGVPGFRVLAGGGMGGHSRVADEFLSWVPATEILRAAETMRRLFDRFGDRTNKHKARLRFVFEKLGKEQVRKEFQALLSDVEQDVPAWSADGLVLRDEGASDLPGRLALTEEKGVRCVRQHQDGYVAVPLHLPLGFVTADEFARLGEIAATFSDEKGLRTTRAQNLLIRFVRLDTVADLAAALKAIKTDVLMSDPLERFVVCAGASTCRLGLCRSRDAAKECAKALREAGVSEATLTSMDIYMNGCPNACGHQPVGPIGCHGAAQRVGGRLVPSYRISLGGRCDSKGAKLGVSLGTVPVRRLPTLLVEMAQEFEREREESECFADYVERRGMEHFAPLLEQHVAIPAYEDGPEFFRDAGGDEDFSLAGRGAGECGSGVFEVIQNDLTAARKATKPFDVLLPTVRALLITRGVDAQEPERVLREFEKHIIEGGLVSAEFRGLLDRARGYLQGWEQAFEGCEGEVEKLLARVDLLYSTLDASLVFHPPEGDVGKREEETAEDEELDLRGVACPMNFVKAKLRLEAMAVGDALAIVLDDGEPVQNVPASFRREGQAIEATTELGGGHWRVVVRKQAP